MNFLNLYYFTIVAEELNITKAAERLFISQQALSNHISKLEKVLGLQLFNRTPGLSLTYAGTRLLRSANQILDIRNQIISEMDDISNHRRGELRIGISHTRGRVLLPKILPTFCKTHPLINISVREGNSLQLEEWVTHGQLDLLVGFAPILIDKVETISILQERLLLVVPKSIMAGLFPENQEEITQKFLFDVDLGAFRDCPFVMMSTGNRTRTIFDHYLKHLGLSVNIVLEMESTETLLSLVCEGMGITVYPEMFYKNLNPFIRETLGASVNFFPINDPSTIGDLVIGYHLERYLSESAKDFIKAALEIGKG